MPLVKNVIAKEHEDEFEIGIDYLLEDGTDNIYLGEINQTQPPEGGHPLYSPAHHFVATSLDKLNQRELFEDLLPPHTSNKDEFETFKQEHGRVVYKQATGSQGAGVSVIDPPEWEPDFLETFIPPKTSIEETGRHPYMIREYVRLRVRNGTITWETTDIFRKQSKTSLTEDNDPNAVYKLNTGGMIDSETTAQRTSPDESDIALVHETTPLVMARLIEQGATVSWDPRRLFNSALIGQYFGYRRALFAGLSDDLRETAEILKAEGIRTAPFGIVGKLEHAIRAAEFGSDLVRLTGHHSIKWDGMMRARYTITRTSDGSIQETLFGVPPSSNPHPSKPNIMIAGEKTPEQAAREIIERYHEYRQ